MLADRRRHEDSIDAQRVRKGLTLGLGIWGVCVDLGAGGSV